MKILNEDLYCSDEAFALMMGMKEHTIADAESALRELDEQITINLNDPNYCEDHQVAIVLLLQPRNFFARFLNKEQLGVPVNFHRNTFAEEVAVQVSDQRVGKHVALYGTKMVVDSVIAALKRASLTKVSVRPYSKMLDLLKAIVNNEVLGIVSVASSGFTESGIRHDYKYLPGKSSRDAETVVLPPVADMGKPPLLLIKVATAVNAMYDGTYGITDAPFVLESELPLLLSRMYIPTRPVQTLVIDDTPRQIEGIEKILRAWQNVTVSTCTVCREAPDFHPDINLILLDEDLGGNLKGAVVHEQLKTRGYAGMVASITGGPKPNHVKFHFGGKSAVATSREAAHQFVDFMNQLLVQLDSK